MADAQAPEEPREKKTKKTKKKKDKIKKESKEENKQEEKTGETEKEDTTAKDKKAKENNNGSSGNGDNGDTSEEKKSKKKSKKKRKAKENGSKQENQEKEESTPPNEEAEEENGKKRKLKEERPAPEKAGEENANKKEQEVPLEKKEKKKKKKEKNKESKEIKESNIDQVNEKETDHKANESPENKEDDCEYVERKGDSPMEEKKPKKKKRKLETKKKKAEETQTVAVINPTTQSTTQTQHRKPLSEESVQKMLELAKIFSDVKMSLQENTDKLDDQEDILTEAEYGVEELERVRNTNQLIWRIDHFQQRYDEAESGDKPIIYSPAFFSHPYGYKMALSLCPFGDGKAKGDYMSIYFCLLQSEMDSLQQWPFTCPIQFSLLDQSPCRPDQKKHLSMEFIPSPIPRNMAFLGRPTSYRNPSLGIPKFALLDDMIEGREKYVRQDTIFIRCAVNIEEIVPI